MGKITEFSIILTSSQLVYYPGQQISGYVMLDLKEPMEMRGLRLKFCGQGYCNWTERHGTGDNRRIVHFTGKKAIIKEMRCLFGSLSTDITEKLVHPAGKHTYQFSFRLPGNVPSSFEGTIGHIRYVLKATVDKPWKFDHKVKCVFTVNDVVDTNLPMYIVAAGGETQKVVGCFFCKAGPVAIHASIDRTCYCPGEAILMNANVENRSSRDMQSLHAKLIQIVTYNANNREKSKTVCKEIARLNGPTVPKGETVKWENQPLGIPATSPTILNCSVVNVRYQLEVIVSVPMGLDTSVKVNVTIGTIPYLMTYGKPVTYDTAEDEQVEPNVPGGNEYIPFQPSDFGYPDMVPPSYSAAVGCSDVNIATDKDEYTYGVLKSTPVYTFAKPYHTTK